MAVDGSFSLEHAMARFLDRCPRLKRVPCFDKLLKKGDKITEEEVLVAVRQLVLHPNYTIPLLGCFRPIAAVIMERTVELLHLAPNLRSDNDEGNMEDFNEDSFLREDGDVSGINNMIDIYVRMGKGLRLHELACLAFCRALDLIPLSLGSILNYFKVAPAPFERIVQCESVTKTLATGLNQLLNVVRASYRFLKLEPEIFTTLWDWSPLLYLVQQPTDLTLINDDAVLDLRWCSTGIITMALRLSFKASANLNIDSDKAYKSFLRWEEFCMDVSMEKGGWHLDCPARDTKAIFGRKVNLKDGLGLKPSHCSSLYTCSSMTDETVSSNLTGMLDTGSPKMPFILTSALTKSFEMVSLAVSQRWPVLLYGPAGCGKTALIYKLALDCGNRVLSIHMDEQIDGKTLVGTYVCTEQPGEFIWQAGCLTQAVLNGFWVVFEDIDKAPADILSILLPLLEGGVTFSTGHGQAVRVNKSFRLFSTLTSSNPDTSHFTEGRNSLGAVWRKIMIAPPTNQDLLNIVLQWYPELVHLAQKLIETFEKMNQLIRFQLGIVSASSHNDRFTPRDLLKFCKRVASLGLCFGEASLTSYACANICKEAIDVFASFSTSAGNRLAIMREISRLWGVTGPEALYPVNKPVIQELNSEFRIGRVYLRHAEMALNGDRKPFVALRASIHALERIACSVKFNEPVLLVGETGTGKTTLVQTLATRLGQKLTVLNLSQQSDVADLLGGFKPVDARFVCIPLYQEFEDLFSQTFSSKDNGVYLSHLRNFLTNKNWKMLLSGFQKGIHKIVEIGKSSSGKKRKRPLSDKLAKAWALFSMKLERAHAQVSASDGMVFSFVEGAFVTALKNGDWILLDEINLAPPEILQRVIGVLENERGSLCLAERGDIEHVNRHPNFRMFACMNPATDAGKRDLPICLRSRFTEYFVDDVLDDEDLVLFITQFMDDDPSSKRLVTQVMQFYMTAKESEERLQDGANQKPHYSLRSLHRALEYLKKARKKFSLEISIYDGFCMFFLNSLDDPSAKLMNNLIRKHFKLESQSPQALPLNSYLTVKEADNTILDSYVRTTSVEKQLKNLARAIFVGRYPVLLQGPTSSGKTSLVWYLAAITGHEFVRINNHEHTDLQEYLGSYITDASGKLVFHEGALVKAVRKGHWIVLDELNLAPSDVLEALNRLVDDNRELFVPELQETIRAHPDFMLFATQNPPVVYAGRKMLSRAFRNRFVEIHVDEIPREELSIILEKRCQIYQRDAELMVGVMKVLQSHRQSSNIFAGKHGFITPRDLFRWADRFRMFGISKEDLACDGYYLMAERLRDVAEKRVVKEVLEKQLNIKFSNDILYKESKGAYCSLNVNNYSIDPENIGKIIWTKTLRRMYFLVERCYKMREPVLLVGETGGGKTTVCQLLSVMLGSNLHVLNCHQYTETSDFLGGFCPVRERSKISTDFQNLCEKFVQSKAFFYFPGNAKFSVDITQASQTLCVFSLIIKGYRECSVSHSDVTLNELDYLEMIYLEMCQLQKNWRTIFTWQDGPLVQAMKRGDMFLVDEISLADDSVLERLNSVLEPERKLSLAEKGGSHLENIVAHPNFFILATMNPGGDYGKKELSPALRNRFTEIWVPSVTDVDELKSIALERILEPNFSDIVDVMLNFWEWFNLLQSGRILTVRDLLSWVSFINVTTRNLTAESAFVHGAFLILLDGLNLGTNLSKVEAAELRVKCLSFLVEKLKEKRPCFDPSSVDGLESYGWADLKCSAVLSYDDNMECENLFGIHPFYIEKGTNCVDTDGFEFMAPTTRRNTLRVLRAMQLNKPVLLEGSPGVGKTSLVAAVGRFSGHKVVRINLSEQTDIMDLLGSDFPVESDDGMQFAWSDGILLQALKDGSWVLLDELNLAPQSVLEGLNAILDHRAEVFIPELGRSFKCSTSFRVFACQNPSYQGGGRKGLPKSFLNRFTKVFVDELVDEDYLSICSSLFPSIERPLLLKLVVFNKRLYEDTMVHRKFGQDGYPWEFNLRDVIRCCQIIQDAPEKSKHDCFLSSIYLQRMRTSADRLEVMKLYEQFFGAKPFISLQPKIRLNPDSLIVGSVSMERYRYQSSRTSNNNLKVLPGLRHCLEAVAQCVKHQWLCILVGRPSTGKTSLIRLLAELTGNVLNELNLSSATDTSEILGSFEQYNASRHYRLVVDKVERYLNEYFNLQVESSSMAFTQRKSLTARWLAFLSKISSSATFIDNPRMGDSILQLVEIIECLKLDIDKQSLPLSYSQNDLDSTLSMIRKLEDYQRSQNTVKFEWVTGLLVKAIENGEWIVLENANLCNPTVLDRINSLVEQSGSITINECGTVDGKPMVLHPHPKFRIFLTVSPSFGEVSRAMRNRGVEIYLMQPSWLPDQTHCMKLHDMELREVKRFIALAGIPLGRLVDMMSNAHMLAKHAGLRIDVSITYLELSRWVQLFQRLVTNGNQPAWSIQISWEHIYLSSLGEGIGKDIVSQAVGSYLSTSQLYKFTSPEDCLLCLPGGWPVPLKLSDYVSYSTEACVTQNIMYLESLGSMIASRRATEGNTSLAEGSMMIRMMDAMSLHGLMFPEEKNGIMANSGAHNDLELALAQKKLYFAADWVMEQATESDYSLYIRWFEWFGVQLHPFFSFFNFFVDLLKEEKQHAIWKKILQLRRELISLCELDKVSAHIPILSTELVDVCPSDGVSYQHCTLLRNLIQCATLLRNSLRQWSKEDERNHGLRNQPLPIFTSLRRVEDKLLQFLFESPTFDVLFNTYSDLLEHHVLFWNSIISSQFECKQISWRLIMKDALKLQGICPDEGELFQDLMIEMERFLGFSPMHLNSSKSLLWSHGGHPILPPSADLHLKQRKLLNLCETIWPRQSKFIKLVSAPDIVFVHGNGLSESAVDGALFSNVELRILAMKGICLSSHIIGEADDNNSEIIQQLADISQMLVERLDFEKQKWIVKLETTTLAPAFSSTCCVFTPEVLCIRSGLESWIKTQPMVDETSLCLDLELLQQLTNITAVDIDKQHDTLLKLSGLLSSSKSFSLNYSARPPFDFSPHQNILWAMGAWELVQGANEKISSFTLDMWFRWHTTLWEACPILVEALPGDEDYNVLLPHKFFWPLKLTMVDHILNTASPVRDYQLHGFKVRAASRCIWQCSENMVNFKDMIRSSAQSLFQQIICAHKKSVEHSSFVSIRAAFHSLQEQKEPLENVNALVSLLASSDHHVFTSLIGSYIEPLLSELYAVFPSDDSSDLQNIGCALLRIGGLRYNLLVCCDDLDPTLKYSIKYSELTKKIASLEIEIQVREECVYFSGSTHQREADSYRTHLLEKLNAERKRLQGKFIEDLKEGGSSPLQGIEFRMLIEQAIRAHPIHIVFRPNPEKYKGLKHGCTEFLEVVTAIVERIKFVKSWGTEEVTKQVLNWQETTSRFIEQLSNEYSDYIDITEPVQVALYEMKLGLSFIVSGVLHKRYLPNGEQNIGNSLETIRKFVRFPRAFTSKTVTVDVGRELKLCSHHIALPTSIEEIDLNVLQNIAEFTENTVSTRETASHAMASTLSFKVSVYHNVLARIRDSVVDCRFLGASSFKLLCDIFQEIACLWAKHREQLTEEQRTEEQPVKFRDRMLKMESIVDIDVWQELRPQELDEKMKVDEESKVLDQDWNAQESDLDGIVNIHNQLFGYVDLVQRPGGLQVSDADRLSSFLNSYMLGVKMTRDWKGLFPSRFDSEIAPEHLLRLCLEHDDKFILSQKSNCMYNFYKDSNSPMLNKLVEPVTLLKQRIIFLMKEWDDNSVHHLALQNILEVCDMILALPLGTPLAKALSALEFLINRIRFTHETGLKLPLSDQYGTILALVSSWHKLEFESWPALLDEVESQFEKNAGKLWFPLYSVFLQGHNEDVDEYKYKISLIDSIDEFFGTSTIGEFKKQLQLLISFHGHICNNLNSRSDASPFQVENAKILYNTFGFYVQFLPRILERIGESRRSIEKELNEILKLCCWDRFENHLAIEKFKTTRLKLRKIVKKYTDLLQQPLMEFSGISISSVHDQKLMLDPYEVIKTLLDSICNHTESKAKGSYIWFADWCKRLERTREIIGGVKDTPSQSSCSYWEEKIQLWHTIETLCVNMIHCGTLWEDKTKKLGKRRAFSDLLKLLESCGLSKHRTPIEGEYVKSHSWLLQPSYEVQHLLRSQNDNPPKNANADLSHLQSSSHEIIWKAANKFYFKSIASNKFLENICLNFHKDFSLIQVKRSGSYVAHLIEILQEQRAGAYNFANKLKCLKHCVLPLANFSSSTIIDSPHSLNQHSTFNCMWQQKQLFDGFCTLLCEEHLLLQTIDNSHLSSCSVIKYEVEKMRLFFCKVLPDFQKSKDILDQHLLGSYEGINIAGVVLHPYGVTDEMEKMVNRNFELIKTFEKDLSALYVKDSIIHILIGHYKDLFAKAHESEETYSSAKARKDSIDERNANGLESDFKNAVEETYKHISGILQRVGSLNCDSALHEESLKNIKEWKTLFEKDAEQLQLDLICEDVLRTTQCAGELFNRRGETHASIGSVRAQLRQLYDLLDLILAFGDNLMQDFIVLHNMVSEITYALANIFALLFSQGFGTTEDQENDCMKEATQDASGTGMGEGAGLNDVSDQIEDEDQLLGTSEKPKEEHDDASEVPSKTEKGIEMEEDFNAEAFDVSEDSEDDENEGNGDEQIESAMGEVGANSDVVDEKVGDINDDDDDDRSANDKYEQGPSVKDIGSKDEELRAKEDSAASQEDANDDDLDAKEPDEDNECGNDEGNDGMKVDKNEAYLDSSGINPDVQNQPPEQDTPMDELEPMGDGESTDLDDTDIKNDEEKADIKDDETANDSIMNDETDSADNNETANDEGSLTENDTETNVQMRKQDSMQSAANDNTVQSLGQTLDDFSATADMGDSAPDQKYSNFSEFNDDLVPTNGQPNASNFEVRIADSMDGKSLTNEQSQTSLPRPDSLIEKPQPNPYRSIGDALDGWKDRIKVSVDIEEQVENSNDMGEDADEYGYTAEFEKGTAQALGPATVDQLKGDITRNDNEMDVENADTTDPTADTEIEKSTSETNLIVSTAVKDVNKQQGMSDLEQQLGEPMEVDDDYNQDMSSFPESVVSIKRSYMSEDIQQINPYIMGDDHLGKANVFELSADKRDDASTLWRRYETLTTRLSQELAEQLRLIMEPTLASKLQGDYRTGKRINMKKVIPYVASQYRKDKIWLRRTRPSKRDYQVVIAVDDSRSMSEGQCGNFALEALVTVCRAMSQLEVGNLAVASFGQQGNIRLLHDFDQPFTPEAGIKMLSSLTFMQENTIADEPVADLLKYVSNLLDDAVMRSRSPFGYNPLQQLVLIIADGRLNEKEKLRRRVRDILSTKRMVAFLVLDSPNESIMDVLDFKFETSQVKESNYMDSFPFPYYVVLKNIEALPRTIVDLLRQWFELMQQQQYSRE